MFGQVLFGGLLAVLLLLGVMRPLMRDLARLSSPGPDGAETPDSRNMRNRSTSHAENTGTFLESKDYERFLNMVRSLARDDPKRVAEHLKRWINENSSR